jgi:uncharacterized protein YeaO (DUF488 family)
MWPLGVKRDALDLDGWVRELAPSDTLLAWFTDKHRQFGEFRKRYFGELGKKRALWQPLVERGEDITLVHDAIHPLLNHATLLKEFLLLKKDLAGPRVRSAKKAAHLVQRGITPPQAKAQSKRQHTKRILRKSGEPKKPALRFVSAVR